MDSAKISEAVKVLTKAEKKLKRLQDGAAAAVATAVQKAEARNKTKLEDGQKEVAAAKDAVAALLK